MTKRNRTSISRAVAGHWPGLAFLIACGVAALLTALALADDEPAPQTGERWGVDELRIRRSAEGHLLDFRYRIVDPERAASMLSKDSPVYVIHEKSGARLSVPNTPKAGPLRNMGEPLAGRTYFALFSNPGGFVQPGDHVSVVVGELNARLTVE